MVAKQKLHSAAGLKCSLAFQPLAPGKSMVQLSSITPNPGPMSTSGLTTLPKFVPNETKAVYLWCTQGEVCATSALPPKIGPLSLPPKKVGDDIAKATGLIMVTLTAHNRQVQMR